MKKLLVILICVMAAAAFLGYTVYDNSFPVGSWSDGKYIYRFNKDNTFSIDMESKSVGGNYKYENNVLTLNFEIDLEYYGKCHSKFTFNVDKKNNGYVMDIFSSTNRSLTSDEDIKKINKHSSRSELMAEIDSGLPDIKAADIEVGKPGAVMFLEVRELFDDFCEDAIFLSARTEAVNGKAV